MAGHRQHAAAGATSGSTSTRTRRLAARTSRPRRRRSEIDGDHDVDVPLHVTYDGAALDAFAVKVDRASQITPRNARLRIKLRHMVLRRARMGWSIDERALADALDPLLADPYATRVVRVDPRARAAGGQRQRPAAAAPRDRHGRPRALQAALLPQPQAPQDLRRRGRDARATRRPPAATRSSTGPRTRSGRRPTSRGPARTATSGSTGGSAENPLKARWMGIVGGVGIHGTAAEESIGSRASHGCIRMRVADVVDLFRGSRWAARSSSADARRARARPIRRQRLPPA